VEVVHRNAADGGKRTTEARALAEQRGALRRVPHFNSGARDPAQGVGYGCTVLGVRLEALAASVDIDYGGVSGPLDVLTGSATGYTAGCRAEV
jgi:hypothetical protein